MKKIIGMLGAIGVSMASHTWAYGQISGEYELGFNDSRTHRFAAVAFDSDPDSVEGHSSDSAEAFWGVKYDAAASSTDSTLATSLSSATQAPASPNLNVSKVEFHANASADSGTLQVEHNSRYRFIVDYELYAAGRDGSASFRFYASSDSRATPENAFEFEIEKTIDSDGSPESLSGSWTSDWVYFTPVEGDPYAASFYLLSETGSHIGEPENPVRDPGAASWQVYTNTSWRYEVEPWNDVTAPVPEPESYALLAAGVAAIAAAKRLKRRHA